MNQQGGSCAPCHATWHAMLNGVCLSDISESAGDESQPWESGDEQREEDRAGRNQQSHRGESKGKREEAQCRKWGGESGNTPNVSLTLKSCSSPKKEIWAPACSGQGRHTVNNRQVKTSSVWPRCGLGRIQLGSMFQCWTESWSDPQQIPEGILFGKFNVNFYRTKEKQFRYQSSSKSYAQKLCDKELEQYSSFLRVGCHLEEVLPVLVPWPSDSTTQIFLGEDGWGQLSPPNCFPCL